MNTQLLSRAILLGLFTLASGHALAKADAKDIARLGQDLTPVGAEKAGNAAGTIPAWTGGITQPPAGYSAEKGYIDPFKDEKPLYTITASNAGQYADQLTAGAKAMLAKFPTYKMLVYPTHRTAALPAAEYEQVRKEAGTVELANGGNGLLSYQQTSVPFPVPANGLEVMYNHITRYRTSGLKTFPTEIVVQANGNFNPVHRENSLVMAWAMGNPEPNRLYYYMAKITAPESVAGSITLIHEPIDQAKESRLAWTYNPGQRRVLRAPEIAYDSPNSMSDGLRTIDQTDMYNGAPNKYDWKLLGKKEMLVPYSTYKLADSSLKYSDILRPNHFNQDLLRYELHRVWVVEATLKPGERHIYAKRVFYVDEDSWSILAADLYDGRGELWRVHEAHQVQRYDVLSAFHISEAVYDLQAGRYLAYGLENEEKHAVFNLKADLKDYSPAALRRSGH
jgi:hypothetical protein